ncbi:MAG TPA: BtaA family protein [Saprospiraceae bacterium]|nr:BtaA family protein [Saprospiraceae bacterium]
MNQIRDWVFNKVHSTNLVYNTCWEDPRCDRELLQFDQDSQIVMITSAGDNALDYLLDQPNTIHCVDVNPRQNALLQLKIAAYQEGNFEDLYQLFGEGKHPEIRTTYQQKLRPRLPEFAREYWDKNLNFFSTKGVRKSFYHYGTAGTFAWMASRYLKTRKKLYGLIQQLFEAQNLAEQTRIFNQIEPKLNNKLLEFFVNRHLTMCLLGVPRSQQELFMDDYRNGALGFISECLRKVFTQLPIQENYFYHLYFYGAYTRDCCPEYLRPENFNSIAAQTDKIKNHTTTISAFLKENPGTYSHFILLDHQDWLAANDVKALEDEWRQILKNSTSGTKILLRSAAKEVDFFPDFVLDQVTFEERLTAKTHQEDRVGTYASVYLAIVN